MKTQIASMLLLVTAAATASAEPVRLGFGDTPSHAPRAPLSVAALTTDPVSEPAPASALPEAPAPRGERTVFGLPKNVGPIDRVLRTVVGGALLGVGIWGLSTDGNLSTTTSGILMGVSAVPLATAATGYCPAYQLFGIDGTF